ncbi:MAG: FG-GAP-like repeat-containing protein, partial [Terriglobales bacterium]
SSGAATVLLGNGDGTFRPARIYKSGGQYSSGIAVADVNGDGHLDLLVSNYCRIGSCYRSGNVGVLLGNGDGTFQSAQSFFSANGNAIAVGDLDQDGRPDVALPTYCGKGDACMHKGVQILFATGDGGLQSAQTLYSGGKSATGIAVQDVNRDGKLDLIVTNYTGNGNPEGFVGMVGVLLGNGDGTFQKVQKFHSGSSRALAVAVGDVNGDGKADLLVANQVVSVLLGTARFATTTTLNSSLNPSIYGQPVSLMSTVASSGSNSTGTVAFRNGSKLLGKVTLNQGAATWTTAKLPAGTLSLTATYSGDSDSVKSTSAAVIQVVRRATSVTTIASSRNPSRQGQPVRFTATVTSPTAKITGTVTFTAGTTTLGTVIVSGGIARLTTSALSPGSNTITATYTDNGAGNIVGSAASLIQTVN